MSTVPPPQPPTGHELLAHPVVAQAMEDAWTDSLPANPLRRHEEGGWIYLNLTTGELSVHRAPQGGNTNLLLGNPPLVAGAILVGTFHTHPIPPRRDGIPGQAMETSTSPNLRGCPGWFELTAETMSSDPNDVGGDLQAAQVFHQQLERREDTSMSGTAMNSQPTVNRLPCAEILRIAHQDAERMYRDLSLYRITLTQEADGWHVDYDFPQYAMAGGGPHYIIDPTSGAILSHRYEQ